MFEDILTDEEKAKIEQFCADEKMAEAVKKVILNSVYNQGVIKKGQNIDTTMNAALVLVSVACSGGPVIDDAALGQDLRGLWRGVQLLQTGFKELAKIKNKVGEGETSETNVAI